MEIRDLIVTPIVLLLVYTVAYFVRPHVCDTLNSRYFFPALSLKIVGALALGFIYQYYYRGGDTFNYHTHGSRILWETFIDSPLDGLAMIFLPKEWHPVPLQHIGITRILFYTDPASYFVVRVSAFVDLFTFSTYSATAVIFAAASFAGIWTLYLAFYRAYPHLVHWLALAILFIPSVFFWGSGVLKDTLVIAFLGPAVFLVQAIFLHKRLPLAPGSFLLVLCLGVIYVTKKYVLLCFVPAAIIWIYLYHLFSIRSLVLRIVVFPMLLVLLAATTYYSAVRIGQGDSRYALDRLAATSKTTAYDIGFYTGRDAGSRYSIGALDGTFTGMLKLAPQAVNASLFRPYLWEANNPLMLIAALESVIFFALTLWVFLRHPLAFFRSLGDPYVIFCLIFSITFAFAVGVSTFNFGTLVRYKIPMLPFYTVALVLMFYLSNKERNKPALERTE